MSFESVKAQMAENVMRPPSLVWAERCSQWRPIHARMVRAKCLRCFHPVIRVEADHPMLFCAVCNLWRSITEVIARTNADLGWEGDPNAL